MIRKLNKVTDNAQVSKICEQIVAHQKMRRTYVEGRIARVNFCASKVRVNLGYSPTLDEDEQERITKEAQELIRAIQDKEVTDHVMARLVLETAVSAGMLEDYENAEVREMVALLDRLPIADWCEEPEQKGFGKVNMAILVGEAGNFNNYSNPGKLWKRFGLWPFTKGGKSQAPSTWMRGNRKSEDPDAPKVKCVKLTKKEWIEVGYCPRRRSVAYNVSDPLIKQNSLILESPSKVDPRYGKPYKTESGVWKQDLPYRLRYLQGKVNMWEQHQGDETWKWTLCSKCKNKNPKNCPTCGGTGHKCKHAHLHGTLLMSKLLIKNLWAEWVKRIPDGQPKSKPWRTDC